MAKACDVQVKPYVGIDIPGIAARELFKTAIGGLNSWKDNLSTGAGAKGNRKPWVNTGEARANLSIQPTQTGHLEYTVGGDIIQLWIAEFGRAPNNKLPPFQAIADWVNEKAIAKRGSPEFDGIVYAIQHKIAKDGIKPFAPGLKAAHDSTRGLEKRIKAALDAEIKAAAAASRNDAGTSKPRRRTG